MIKTKSFAIFIPARFKSTRFPGKPLVKILGKEMLSYVYDTCNQAFPNKVFVLTDDRRISNFCKKKKIFYYLTSNKCKTGTDRIIEIKKKINLDLYINVQGDEPLLEKYNLILFIKKALKFNQSICIGRSKIKTSSFFNNNIPKVVVDELNNLIYISRAPIPSSKKKIPSEKFGQVNLYSYPRKFLNAKLLNKKSKLEEIEDIEIIRFLERGEKIKVVDLISNNHPVDIPSDIRTVENILKKKDEKTFNNRFGKFKFKSY